ncbi:MAG: cupin domain-containing protein, partial [Thermodesulfobacteriota bacterium]
MENLDAVKVASESYKVFLENDKVRVLEYRIKPGEKNAMHSHPDFLFIALIPEKYKMTFPDGKTIESEANAGEVFFCEAETHSYENTGSTEAHGFLIEL